MSGIINKAPQDNDSIAPLTTCHLLLDNVLLLIKVGSTEKILETIIIRAIPTIVPITGKYPNTRCIFRFILPEDISGVVFEVKYPKAGDMVFVALLHKSEF